MTGNAGKSPFEEEGPTVSTLRPPSLQRGGTRTTYDTGRPHRRKPLRPGRGVEGLSVREERDPTLVSFKLVKEPFNVSLYIGLFRFTPSEEMGRETGPFDSTSCCTSPKERVIEDLPESVTPRGPPVTSVP